MGPLTPTPGRRSVVDPREVSASNPYDFAARFTDLADKILIPPRLEMKRLSARGLKPRVATDFTMEPLRPIGFEPTTLSQFHRHC